MRIVQFYTQENPSVTHVAVVDGDKLNIVAGVDNTYQLCSKAISSETSLDAVITESGIAETISYQEVIESGCLLPPVTHADPAHMILAGTGLTHLGSASARSAMHEQAADQMTDSMRMFKWGVDGGKPEPGTIGVEPEWFYKGDGSWLVAPGQPLELPEYAQDGGEEPEICGIYLIADDGTPYRIGFALANEYSDHVLEKQNYLWLAHSKLRQCSFGPELLVGDLPQDIKGKSCIYRAGKVLWEKDFASGEQNMSHYISNLEYHHFKYQGFRRPGDIHVHFFGTATLSFADKIDTEPGDIFEISAECFGKPLRNQLKAVTSQKPEIKTL